MGIRIEDLSIAQRQRIVESTRSQHAAQEATPKPSKYRNVRAEVAGERFDSKAEANYWSLLLARKDRNEISGLRRQVRFPLYTAPTQAKSLTRIQVSEYIADFVYTERVSDSQTRMVVADKKGKRTQLYALKKKWLELQDGIVIEEV